MTGQSDSTLMARYAVGDEEAFEELFARYGHRILGYFSHRLRSRERAWDLSQEVFLRLHRHRERYDPLRPFSPWLFRIVRNVLMDDFRRPARQRETVLLDDGVASCQPDADRRIEHRERLQQLLGRVSPEQADLVVAAKLEGLGYAELAGRFGKSVVAIKQSASRALRQMRLEEENAA